MPREVTTIENPNFVFRLSRRRQEVEAGFARAVYNVFNQGPALRKLQGVAGSLMKLMTNGPGNAFDAALSDEGFLRLWERVPKNRPGMTMWQHPMHLRKLDATDCADVIRLAGAWVERGGLQGGAMAHMPRGNDPGTAKEAFRVGGKPVWGPGARVRDDGWDIEPHLVPYMRDQHAAFTGMAGQRGHHGKKKSKRAAGSSSVLQLDRLFGLIVACDISGTTADCVFALELFGAEYGLTAAYYMLPLGTIVHNMHHSVLEVALVASLNGEMDYHVGFFDTLRPTRAGAFPAELNGLQQAIDVARAQMQNEELHHLRYYQGHLPKGVFQFRRHELAALRTSSISDAVEMLGRAPCLGGYPQRSDVVRLLQSEGFAA